MIELTFTDPIFLWLLVSIPFLILTHFYTLQYIKRRAMRFANFEALNRVTGGQALSKNIPLLIVRLFTLLFLVSAVAGPTLWYLGQSSEYNYVLALDASGSMLADDFKPNRLEAAKSAANQFIDSIEARVKMGVISFSGIGYVEQFLTDDRSKIKLAIDYLQIKSVHGTAIGEALKAAANILLSEERARITILLTDGRENVATREELDKIIDYVAYHNIIVHTIGVATEEGGKLPGLEAVSTIDEPMLMYISNSTGGNYYKAETPEQLTEAYESIVNIEKVKVPIRLALPFMLIALLLLGIEWALVNTKFRTIP
ncbi:VWA domain-containing protein [Candidatus Woesearchaeota archaeon]|nr:VWA domain-containing protein [Candidatus Woesearchaeota archaeon]